MVLALSVTAIVIVVLLWEVAIPHIERWNERRRARRQIVSGPGMDPGRERRAEQRARALLRSCVNDEEWAMYRDLGFLRVWGRLADGPGQPGRAAEGAPYAYLVYPHKPIVAYLPQTRELLTEYCVAVPRRDAALRLRAAARLRRRAGEVDGADRRRAAAHHEREHAPAGPPGRSEADPPRPLAPRAVGAGAAAPRRPQRRARRRAVMSPQPAPRRG